MRHRHALLVLVPLVLCPLASAQIPVPTPSPQAADFHQALFHLWMLEEVLVLAALGWLVFSGRGAVLAQGCLTLCRGRRACATLLFGAAAGLLYAVPILIADLIRSQRLAPFLERPPPAIPGWLVGRVGPMVALILALAVGGWVLHLVVRRSPRWWWLWLSGGLTVAMSVYLLVLPMIDAEQRAYRPIEATALAGWRPRIDSITAKAGATSVPVLVRVTLEGDFCRTSNSAIGLGPTRAIVLADQIFTEWDPAMVDVAVAHELKHHLFDNTWLPIVLLASLIGGGGLLIHVAGSAIIGRLGKRIGCGSLGDAASLPLLLLLLQLYLLLAVPAFNLTAQARELGADRFALDLTHDNRARSLVSANACGNLWLAEDPWFDRLYLNTHPSIGRRVRFANQYRPWESGAKGGER